MTPGGTSRIVTPSGFAASKLVPVGVATISTQLPGKPLHVPKMPAVGAGGAVYTTVATPLELVTNVRADSVPKSCPTPFTNMSRRTGCPDFGLPSGPMALTWMDDCDPPSWLMLSGSADRRIVSARPDGPESPGASV